jgi:hypothetical protein
MADSKIKDLTLKGTVAATDELVINDVAGGDLDKKITPAGIKTFTKAGLVASDVTDFDTEVSNNTQVTANTAKTTNQTHTGDVTGSVGLTIAAGAVDIAMHSATGTPDATTYYRGDNTWATPAGSGTWTDSSSSTGTNKTLNDFTNSIAADETHLQARNTSGITMNKGEVVHISGYNVGADLPEMDLADSDTAAAMPAIGMVEDATIANNANGGVIMSGRIAGIDTSAFTAGDKVYVSTTAGGISTRPTGTDEEVQLLGEVLRSHATLGVMELVGAGRANDIPNTMADNLFEVSDNADITKVLDISLGGATTATTTTIISSQTVDRSITLPDVTGTLLTSVVEDTTPQLGADLDCQGSNIDEGGVINLIEQAAADADVAGRGQLWVKTATPNQLWFTRDDGTELQIDTAGGGSNPTMLVAVKTSDETINSDSTMTTDTDLQFSPTINKMYSVEGLMLFDVDATPDIKFTFTGPSGATMSWRHNPSSSTMFNITSIVAGAGVAGQIRGLNIVGTLFMSSTGGTVGMQWAQNVSDAADTILKKGSWLKLVELD